MIASVAAGVGAAAVTLGWAAAGFWWFDGLAATIARYEAGVASQRPFTYFVWANLAAFAIAVGPAGAIGLAYLRRSKLVWVVGAAGASLILADLSGLSKGEVERIWLPFVPWILLGTATLPDRLMRGLIAGQAAIGITVQALIRTPW